MAISTFFLLSFLAVSFFGLSLAAFDNVCFDNVSCSNALSGTGCAGFADAAQEAVAMAANAAKLMGDAAPNPESDESKRVHITLKKMLTCDPKHTSCTLAQSYLSHVAQLQVLHQRPTYSSTGKTTWVFCEKDEQVKQAFNGQSKKSMCTSSNTAAQYILPNMVILYPGLIPKFTAECPTAFGNRRI